MSEKLKVVETQANELLKQYKLYAWRFKFDNAKNRFGYCSYRKQVISLSKYLVELNPLKESFNTLLHEIAHALVGASNNHNRVWKRKAIEIGCTGDRCHSAEMVKPKFIGTCPNCQRTVLRHRRRGVACLACCFRFNQNKFSESFLFEWDLN